jgi:hypothetical protein
MPSALTGDDIFVAPSAATAFIINGSLPGPFGPGRDRLTLDLTGIQNPRLRRLGLHSGFFLFDNALPVFFTSIERLVF